MRDRLDDLGENLLQAGLSPRHVQRYLRELAEHRQDIADHLLVQGLSPAEAHRQADRRLGDGNALLLPMLADRRFRSWAARWPALFYLALPLVVQLALIVASAFFLILAAGTGLRSVIGDLGTGVALLLLVAPVIIAWLTLWAAHRRRAASRWPLLGAFVGVVLAAAIQFGVTPPAADMAGQIGVTVAAPSLLLLLPLLLLSLLPLVLQPHLE